MEVVVCMVRECETGGVRLGSRSDLRIGSGSRPQDIRGNNCGECGNVCRNTEDGGIVSNHEEFVSMIKDGSASDRENVSKITEDSAIVSNHEAFVSMTKDTSASDGGNVRRDRDNGAIVSNYKEFVSITKDASTSKKGKVCSNMEDGAIVSNYGEFVSRNTNGVIASHAKYVSRNTEDSAPVSNDAEYVSRNKEDSATTNQRGIVSMTPGDSIAISNRNEYVSNMTDVNANHWKCVSRNSEDDATVSNHWEYASKNTHSSTASHGEYVSRSTDGATTNSRKYISRNTGDDATVSNHGEYISRYMDGSAVKHEKYVSRKIKDDAIANHGKYVSRTIETHASSNHEGSVGWAVERGATANHGKYVSNSKDTDAHSGPHEHMGYVRTLDRTIQDPGSQRLTWYKPPLSVLVIKKIFDDLVIGPFVELITWLVDKRHMLVFIEAKTFEEPPLMKNLVFCQVKQRLNSFREGEDDLTDKIDFIICLGGDGTLLYASSLFQESLPPIMAFHLGSLGFLSPFDFTDFREKVTQVLEGNAALTLRTRLKCVVNKKGSVCSREDGSECSIKNVESKQHILVLNEVVIDRGPSPYICNIDLYIEHKYITSVQGDGLIISSPTGSTAYAAAAGASMIHPNVPAMLIAPVCPHSLSFRPIVVPAGIEIKVMISPEARSSAWVSFDGRQRQELCKGDILRIGTSIYPVPSICAEDQISDWFRSLAGCLHWNERKHQRAFMYNGISAESLDTVDQFSNGERSFTEFS